MKCVERQNRGQVVNVDINKMDYMTIGYPGKGMMKSYVKDDDHPFQYIERWTGPNREAENMKLCVACGHYHSNRVRECNNPGCKRTIVTKKELIEILVTEFKERNGHKLSINGTPIKP